MVVGPGSRGVPRKVWLSQYGHVDPFDFRRDAWVSTLHQWFDHWLWHVPNDVMKQPRASIESGAGRLVSQSDWPSPSGPAAEPVSRIPTAHWALPPSSGGACVTDTRVDEGTLVSDPTTDQPCRLAYRLRL